MTAKQAAILVVAMEKTMNDAIDLRADRPMRMPTDTSVNLLWTSGWDSTFQLLRLLLKYRVRVQPWYLEDPTRASAATELRTMQRIGDALLRAYPWTEELLQPLRTRQVAGLGSDPEISEAFREVRTRTYIGSQYEWLALFCKRDGIGDMELSVHVDDKVHAVLTPFVEAFAHPCRYRSYRVDRRHADTAEFTLFRYFGLPLFEIDKLAMAAEAEREGWRAFMDMTWFCHRPLLGQPCGMCAPCVYTIEEGLAERIPRGRRALSFVYRKMALPLKPPLRAALASVRKR